MRRRTMLALAGTAAAGLAGCLSGSDPGTATDDPGTDTAPNTDAAEYDVTASVDALQPGVVTADSADSIGVTMTAGQYLYADVAAESDERPAREEFAFAFDGAEYEPMEFEPAGQGDPYRLYQGNRGYSPEAGEGWLLFDLPGTGDAADAKLTWPGGELVAEASLRERLGAPHPDLSATVTFPETLEQWESPEITVEVTNEGDVAGRYVAGLNRIGPMVAYAPVNAFSVLVPAGETVTETYADSLPWDHMSADDIEERSEFRYRLDSVDGEADAEVSIVTES